MRKIHFSDVNTSFAMGEVKNMTRQRSRDICRSLRAETDRRQKQKKQLKSAQLTEA